MARKKKNDFWDDVEDLNTVSDNDQTGDDDTAEVAVDEEWSAVKSLPLKVIMRFLLMVSCLVALVSAYIAYEYVNDRYAGGSYSTDFFDSASFADEYNKSMDQLLQLVQAMEADVEVESLSRTVYQGDGNEICLYEKLADERDDMQQLVNHVFLQDLLQKLPGEEQELIRYRYYDNLTQVETAKRMGISQVQVSRLEKKTLGKLRSGAGV